MHHGTVKQRRQVVARRDSMAASTPNSHDCMKTSTKSRKKEKNSKNRCLRQAMGPHLPPAWTPSRPPAPAQRPPTPVSAQQPHSPAVVRIGSHPLGRRASRLIQRGHLLFAQARHREDGGATAAAPRLGGGGAFGLLGNGLAAARLGSALPCRPLPCRPPSGRRLAGETSRPRRRRGP